jgi:transposase
MGLYPARSVERAMKFQEVILKAMSKQITCIQAAEILGMSDRNMRRYRNRLEKVGYGGLIDGRTRRPSPKRVPMGEAERVLRLYREQYFDFNVRHFHEKLRDEPGITLSYTWVKNALQEPGLVGKAKKRGRHHKRRPGWPRNHRPISFPRWRRRGRRMRAVCESLPPRPWAAADKDAAPTARSGSASRSCRLARTGGGRRRGAPHRGRQHASATKAIGLRSYDSEAIS